MTGMFDSKLNGYATVTGGIDRQSDEREYMRESLGPQSLTAGWRASPLD